VLRLRSTSEDAHGRMLSPNGSAVARPPLSMGLAEGWLSQVAELVSTVHQGGPDGPLAPPEAGGQ
jgi:hypothetical protein